MKKNTIITIIVTIILMILCSSLYYFIYTSSPEYKFCNDNNLYEFPELRGARFDDYTNLICNSSNEVVKVKKVCLSYDNLKEVCSEWEYVLYDNIIDERTRQMKKKR